MFKKRSLQVSVVKTPKTDTVVIQDKPRLNDSEINLIKSVAKGVGVYLLATAVTMRFSDAICEIAVNRWTPSK